MTERKIYSSSRLVYLNVFEDVLFKTAAEVRDNVEWHWAIIVLFGTER